jgi:hypothetical protein
VEIRQRDVTGRALLAASLLALAAASGCATGTKTVKTPRYTLAMPDFWQVKAEGLSDGVPTVVIIGKYGSAIIDEGSGAIDPKATNYESVQADVEVRVFAWPAPQNEQDPSVMVGNLLARDGSLHLTRHVALPDQPPECGLLKKKYTILGGEQDPLDLVSRPGWRTIVVGGTGQGNLVGVVARVEYEQDMGRYCHNLSNMQVQLQNLLDGLTVVAVPGAASAGGASGPEKTANP